MTAADPALAPREERLDSYQRKLLAFLSVATFFEGFDFFAMSQVLPLLRAEWSLGKDQAGLLVSSINVGTIAAYFLVRKADRWGRRRVLNLTIVGYMTMSLLSGLAPSPYFFAVAQAVARVFLIAEWAVALIYAAEEFPASRRGLVIGLVQANSSLGAIVCAGVVPLLSRSSLGWRTVFLIGVVPLVVIAFARRGIRETSRFAAQAPPPAQPLSRIWRTPYRTRLGQIALIWGLTYVCTQTAITFWKEFAVSERGWSDADVAGALTFAAVASMPFVFGAGKVIDKLGRRRGAVLVFVTTALGIVGAYTLDGHVALACALAVGIFGTNSVLPVLNAYTTELFPTELRGDAFAWANNLLGRTGYVLAPLAVGVAAERVGWGWAVASTAAFPLLALGCILLLLPETTGKELEETSRL